MNDPQKPKHSLEHLQAPSPRMPPIPLEYGHRRYPEQNAGLHIYWQFALGFGFWLVAVGIFVCALQLLNNANIAIAVLGPVELLSVIGLTLWLRSKYDWRGVIPGMALTCLVPIGIITVVCGGFH
jgi:hypothetical protein